MSAISKTSPPSLVDSCTHVVLTVSTLKLHSGFWKQKRSFSLDIWNVVISRKHADDNLVVYSHQKKDKAMVSKGVSNLNKFQKFNNRNEFEFSNSIATYGILLIAIISNYLQELHNETVRLMTLILFKNFIVFKFLKPTISFPSFLRLTKEMKFVKCLKYLSKSPVSPSILDLFYRPMVIKIIFAKDPRHFPKSPEILSPLEKISLQMPPKVKRISGGVEYTWKAPVKSILESFYLQMPFEMKLCTDDLEQIPNFLETPVSRIADKTELRSLKSYRKDDNELEHIHKLPEKPVILDPVYLQFPFKTKLYAKDSKQLHKLPGFQVSTWSLDKTQSQSMNSIDEDDRVKLFGMCYSCKELISEKKFFDERRFGILKKCDCRICYGCLRKKAGTSGVVMGPIGCPSCSVKSDIVAASARWIEGVEKLRFFELLLEHADPKYWDRNEDKPLSPCPNTIDSRTLEEVKEFEVYKSDTVVENAHGTIGKNKLEPFDLLQRNEAPRMKSPWTGFNTRKDYFYTRAPLMGLVN
ncbi:unnamed protein product [Larinioides sclopetarius]|uniref:Uncharacterized protein n=1 Tax=Larinioides sclopetarius TaxID=280406 RepID=A0AAV2ALH0_9ARAC